MKISTLSFVVLLSLAGQAHAGQPMVRFQVFRSQGGGGVTCDLEATGNFENTMQGRKAEFQLIKRRSFSRLGSPANIDEKIILLIRDFDLSSLDVMAKSADLPPLKRGSPNFFPYQVKLTTTGLNQNVTLYETIHSYAGTTYYAEFRRKKDERVRELVDLLKDYCFPESAFIVY